MNVKSDAEIITFFQAHKEKFNQLIQEEFQSQKDYEVLRLEVSKKNAPLINELNQIIPQEFQLRKELETIRLEMDKKDKTLRNQLKKNEEVIKNNDELKFKETVRLQEEISKNSQPLSQFNNKKRSDTNKFLEEIGMSVFTSKTPLTKWMCARSHHYEETHFSHNDFRTLYDIQKGIAWFDENNQPDKQYVFENLNDFHASDFITIDAQNFVRKFGQDCGTLYLNLEGNWYIFLTVCISKKYPDPIDGYNY